MDPEKITYEMVSKKQRELAQARGRRSTDRQTQLEMLHFLVRVSKGPAQKLEVRPPRSALCRTCYLAGTVRRRLQAQHEIQCSCVALLVQPNCMRPHTTASSAATRVAPPCCPYVLLRARTGGSSQWPMALPARSVPSGSSARVQVLMQLVSTLFDLSVNLNTSIPVHVWQRAARALFQVMDVLEEHQHIVLEDSRDPPAERTEEPPADAPFKVVGNLRAFVERLDDELFKILQVRSTSFRIYSRPLFLAPAPLLVSLRTRRCA